MRIWPPSRLERFDRGNYYGSHCLQAIVPGWDYFNGSVASATSDGTVVSVGQRHEFAVSIAGSTTGTVVNVTRNYGRGIGSVRAAEFTQAGDASLARLLRTDDDLGIRFPDTDNLAMAVLFRPSGDGRAGGAIDPRIYSKDTGSGANDHDFMVGISNSGNSMRARLRSGGSTQTIVAGAVQDNGLSVICAGFKGGTPYVQSLTENGAYTLTNGTGTSGYDPRTTTDIAIGSNAGVTENNFSGDVIGVFAFDCSLVGESHLRQMLTEPWQIFPEMAPDPGVLAAQAHIGGGITDQIPPGALLLTGTAPTTRTIVRDAIPEGALILTGFAPTTRTIVRDQIPPGQLILTGVAPSTAVRGTIVEPIPPGTLRLTGFAPIARVQSQQVEEEDKAGGGPSRRARRRRRWRVRIGERFHWVSSQAELRYLLQRYEIEQRAKLATEQSKLLTPTRARQIKAIRGRINRAEKRVQTVKRDYARELDDEILTLYMAGHI